jgi:hypothetical protein
MSVQIFKPYIAFNLRRTINFLKLGPLPMPVQVFKIIAQTSTGIRRSTVKVHPST